MAKRIICRALIGFLAFFSFLVPVDISAGKQQTREVEASAHNPSLGIFEKSENVDRKQVDIEESYTYVSHSVLIITANPKENNGRWSCSDGLVRGEDGRVEAVWVEVKARNMGLLEGAVRVRARLMVMVEERVPGKEGVKERRGRM